MARCITASNASWATTTQRDPDYSEKSPTAQLGACQQVASTSECCAVCASTLGCLAVEAACAIASSNSGAPRDVDFQIARQLNETSRALGVDTPKSMSPQSVFAHENEAHGWTLFFVLQQLEDVIVRRLTSIAKVDRAALGGYARAAECG